MTSKNTIQEETLLLRDEFQRSGFQMPEQTHRAGLRFQEGIQFREVGRREEALERIAEAVLYSPSNTEYLLTLGQLEFEMGHLSEAALCFEKLTIINPMNPSYWLTLGYIDYQREEYQRALLPFAEAVRLDAGSPEGTFYYAESLRKTGHFEESLHYYQRLLPVGTRLPQAVYGYALSLLTLGRLEEGWEAFEFRKVSQIGSWQQHLLSDWSGVPESTKTVLAYSEEGLSADVLFASCLPDLIESTGRCLVECEQSLHSLFARSFPKASFVPLSAEPILELPDSPAWNRIRQLAPEGEIEQVALGSLPRFFRKRLSDFPQRKSYLLADGNLTKKWRQTLSQKESKGNVGILWQGSWSAETEKQRSIPLDALKTILDCGARHSLRWICLQQGSRQADLTRIRSDWQLEIGHYPDVLRHQNVEELAGLLSALELVVSPPGYVANLAAALGTPVWLVLPYPYDWRWTIGEGEIAWFPGMRAFRQEMNQPWPEVVREIETAIKGF